MKQVQVVVKAWMKQEWKRRQLKLFQLSFLDCTTYEFHTVIVPFHRQVPEHHFITLDFQYNCITAFN